MARAPVPFSRLAGTDRAAEEQGRWFEDILGPMSGVHVKLRRMTSPPVDKAYQSLIQANHHRMVKGKFPKEVDEELLYEMLGDAVILDWKGIFDDEGNEVVFSPETAKAYVKDYPDFRRLIVNLAGSMDAFRKEMADAVEKN
jgi:hypothetical protein